MIKIAPYTFKVLSHIVKIGSGDDTHSRWYLDAHPGTLVTNCLRGWLQIDGEDIRPKCHDVTIAIEYLDIVETEKDFQDWYEIFVK